MHLCSSFPRAGALMGLLAVSLSASAPAAPVPDWFQWRGPQRNAICPETGLLPSWPAGGPKLVWKTDGLGAGFSTVSVVGDRIYTMGDSPESSEVRALAAADGRQLWAAKVGKPGGGGGFPGPRCTPTVDGASVFALGQDGALVALDAASGKELWRRNLGRDFGGKMMSGWGYSESPLVDGNLVICTPGGGQGTLLALNKRTGEKVWQSGNITEDAAYASAIVITNGGVRQFVQLTAASVFGVDAASGKLLWRAPRPGKTAVIPTPVYSDGIVYVTSGYGVGCTAFRVSKEGSTFKAEQLYDNKVMVNHHGGVVKIGDQVYGYSDGKGWTCQDFKTGEPLWQEKDKLGKGAILAADGLLLCRGEDRGTMVLIESNPRGWVEKGRFEQPGRSDKKAWPHPVIAGGRLYLRDHNTLLCYAVK